MNSTKAVCGHYVWAIGAPNSIARLKCESEICDNCKEEKKAEKEKKESKK